MKLTLLFGITAAGSICAGAVLGFDFANHTTVHDKAVGIARQQVDMEMRASCSNWFTDKRTAQLPENRIVVCRAPAWMSNPKASND